jgi:ribonuclease HI
VWAVCSSIRRNGFDLTMSKTAMDMFLMPALRTGLRVVDAPDRVLKRWDDLLRRAILDGAGISRWGVNVLAFPLVLGFPTLERFRWALRGEELMVTLIADYPCSRTARARRRAVSLARGSRAWARRCAYTRSRDQRTLEGLSASGVFVTDGEFGPAVRSSTQRRQFIPTDPVWSSWTPYVCPIVREVRSPTTRDTGGLPRRVVVFTDGSSGKDPGEPSGCSVVVTADGQIIAESYFACRASGNNYLAEALAGVAATLCVPSSVDLDLVTDAKSYMQALEKGHVRDWAQGTFTKSYALSQRARILCAARPVLRMARAVVCARRGDTCVQHVRSHSGGTDFFSRMNDRADVLANKARLEFAGRADELPLTLYGDAAVRMMVGRVPVIGSFKKAILREAEARLTKRLAAQKAPAARNVAAPLGRRVEQARTARDMRARGRANRAQEQCRTRVVAAPPPLPPAVPEAAHSARLFASNPGPGSS